MNDFLIPESCLGNDHFLLFGKQSHDILQTYNRTHPHNQQQQRHKKQFVVSNLPMTPSPFWLNRFDRKNKNQQSDSDTVTTARTNSESSLSVISSASTSTSSSSSNSNSRHNRHRLCCPSKHVRFEEATVKEFIRSPHETKECLWYSRNEIDSIKRRIRNQIQHYDAATVRTNNSRTTPTTTTTHPRSCCWKQRVLMQQQQKQQQQDKMINNNNNKNAHTSCLYSHPLLKYDSINDQQEDIQNYKQDVIDAHVQTILIVSPNDLASKLFCKSIQQSWSSSSSNNTTTTTTTTTSSSINMIIVQNSIDAIHVHQKQHLDIVFIEERLHLFHRCTSDPNNNNNNNNHNNNNTPTTANNDSFFYSGSQLLQYLKQQQNVKSQEKETIYIGISNTHFQKEKEMFQKCGADDCIPMSSMSSTTSIGTPITTIHSQQQHLDGILQILMEKRTKTKQ